MKNKTTTAVEWLKSQFQYTDNKLFDQAIELEKQQIIQTYKIAQVNVMINATVRAEQHYSETYKKPKQ
jgi:hypothetical protein